MRRLVLAAVLAAWLPQAASAQPSAPVVIKTDVIYGRVEGSALLANLAYPDGPALKPAILSVHGGRWRAGNRADASSIKVAQWAEFGFFAMSIDYRLVGGSPAPAPYLDLLCAIRWVHAHAEEYRIDPERIYLIGQSAGGQLVSLVATIGEADFPRVGGWEKARSDVRARGQRRRRLRAEHAVVGQSVDAGRQATSRRRAPRRRRSITSRASTKPILVIHSDDDKSVPVQQAVDMAAKLKAAGVTSRFVHYTDRGHMGITDEVIKEARAFIGEVEPKK